MKDKKDMQSKINHLLTSNTAIQAQNKKLKAKVDSFQSKNHEMQSKVSRVESKNQELKNLLAIQNERLERLEQIALASPKDKKTASSFFNLSKLFLSMKGILVSRNQ